MTDRRLFLVLLGSMTLALTACSGKPGVDGLRDSFAQQLSSNRAVSDFKRNGDELTFTGPGVEGPGMAKWRVHIDSATIEETGDERAPYKGTVKSSWFADDQPIKPSASGRDSNLPVQLTSNGLAQDCW